MLEILKAQQRLFDDHGILITVFSVKSNGRDVFRSHFRHIPEDYQYNPSECQKGKIVFPQYNSYPEALSAQVQAATSYLKNLVPYGEN